MTKQTDPILPPGAKWSFFLLSSCFMWWAIANNLTDPLVKVFQEVFGMTTFQASTIQFAFYFGYFCMALPGALIARIFTYKTGVLVGLGVYAIGCFLLYPAMLVEKFWFFCLGYYVLACGLSVLETSANPYVLALGSVETATRRLNFAQSFNPIGSVTGILMCQIMIMANLPKGEDGQLSIAEDQVSSSLNTVIYPYLTVAVILSIVWFLILFTRMPTASDSDHHVDPASGKGRDSAFAEFLSDLASTFGRLIKNGNYLFSVFAQFCYVGTQISVWTYTNYYIPAQLGVTQEVALMWHTGALVLFGCSRWIFTGLMNSFRASSLLLFAAIMACIMCLTVVFVGGMPGVIALVFVSGFMSLMFPTIFGLGCTKLGQDTKLAASGHIMAIVGGAIITPAQGWIVDFGKGEDLILVKRFVSMSYLLPLVCFVVICIYAITGRKHEDDLPS